MTKIAISGNIAAGKSLVETILKSQGYQVFDTDEFAHRILENSEEIKKAFIHSDVFEEGKISRRKLGALVFAKPEMKQLLESIVHPIIKDMIQEIPNEGLVFVSVPLLFEAKMQDLFDKTIFVTASRDLRLKRLMARNSLSEMDALLRINAQEDEAEKIKASDFVIENNGTQEELLPQIRRILLLLT